ncbi:MAG: outer membrane protein assembly factor BamA [Kiritimatiellae bacterium]|nr:outer membrane protein assembly factor BamA [Kiritimatiellia bacterium]
MKTLVAILAAIAVADVWSAQIVDVTVVTRDAFGGDTGSILTRCQTKAGQTYDPAVLTLDVVSLKDSNEFEDISADASEVGGGIAVTFYVKRKFRYHAPLVVTGAEFFGVSKIAKEAGLKDGYLYGESDLAAAAANVRLAYNKKHFPDATASVRAVPDGTGGDCSVVVAIEEGPRQKIVSYSFPGAEGVDEDELREAIGDLPWWNPLGWFSDSPTTGEQLVQCVAKIEEVYRNHGYLDVRVGDPVRVPVGDEKVDVQFSVSEGVRYTVGKTSITGLTRYSEANVRENSAIPEAGAVAGAKALADAARSIEVAVGSGDSGLADTHVSYKTIPSESDPSVADVVFSVVEGVPVVINEVLVRGNDYTKDKVIRREIDLGPGDSMLEDRAERSKRRLENLDYFSRVRYGLEPAGKGKNENGAEYRNLVYEVDEKNTGSFMVGVGASSVDSVYVSAEVSQSNFDLFAPGKYFRGGGQKGRLYVAAGPRIQSYEASVTEPYFLDRLLELTVEAYRRSHWYDDYDIIRSGGAATLAYPVKFWPTWKPFGRFGVRLGGEFIEFDDVEKDYYDYKGDERRMLKEEERKYGDAAECVVRLFWSHDDRDNFRIPTTGSRSQIFLDVAGGDNEYYRLGVHHRHYFSPWRGIVSGESWLRQHVFMAALRAETIEGFGSNDYVPIYNRMFLGGPKSIRGIEYRYVSPYLKKTDHNDYIPWGGQTLFCMNFEYTVPVVKMVRVAVFSDLGSVGEDDFDLDFSDTFAWTVGVGIRLDIPMFPIRLDFATPIEKPDHCEEEVFSFTVSYDF